MELATRGSQRERPPRTHPYVICEGTCFGCELACWYCALDDDGRHAHGHTNHTIYQVHESQQSVSRRQTTQWVVSVCPDTKPGAVVCSGPWLARDFPSASRKQCKSDVRGPTVSALCTVAPMARLVLVRAHEWLSAVSVMTMDRVLEPPAVACHRRATDVLRTCTLPSTERGVLRIGAADSPMSINPRRRPWLWLWLWC